MIDIRPPRSSTEAVRLPRRRLPRRFVDVVLVAAGLAVGLGGAALLARGAKSPATLPDLSVPISPAASADQAPASPVLEGDAANAAAAVTGYLDAELGGDIVASYGYLSSADREAIGSAESWALAHADLFPMTAYEIIGTAPVEDGVDVRVDVTYESSLDEVVGLVPARAEAAFRAVEEDAGWRVELSASTLEPRYPDDTAAAEAVAAWAAARQACEQPAEYEGGLVGSPALADALCGTEGAVAVGAAEALEGDPAATPVIAAFGGDAAAWARAVDVAGPVQLRAVVAPVGDEWVVVGVLPAPPGETP